jgi:uncharacterized protein (TIGR02246 family)
MTRDDVARWIDAYMEAWRTYDRDAIADLFTPDAEYRDSPYESPVLGREAIVAHWLDNRDEPGTWRATYEAWAVDNDRAVVVGKTDYDEADGKKTYHNVFLCRFDDDGRCREYTEVYLLQR